MNGKFFRVNEPNSEFKLHFLGRLLPVLWNRNGEYCVIPIAVLQNAYDVKNAYNKSIGKITYPKIVITWEQGIPISNQAGRALEGE